MSKQKKTTKVSKPRDLVPFGEDGIDCLSLQDKIQIFSSEKHPIEMIIAKVNFDPNKPEHHNCCYDKIRSEFGLIYLGKEEDWTYRSIGIVIHDLIKSKIADLKAISDDLKVVVTNDSNKQIQTQIKELRYILKPRNETDVEFKRTLIDALQQQLYDGKEMPLKIVEQLDPTHLKNQISDDDLMQPEFVHTDPHSLTN